MREKEGRKRVCFEYKDNRESTCNHFVFHS